MAAPTRRTPFEDEMILQEWEDLHRYYTQDLGLSKRQSYYRISERFGLTALPSEFSLDPVTKQFSDSLPIRFSNAHMVQPLFLRRSAGVIDAVDGG